MSKHCLTFTEISRTPGVAACADDAFFFCSDLGAAELIHC